jgi:DNA-directed RNA polymerase subunit beta
LNDFIEIQLNSFCWFLSEGLIEELEDFSSILDFTGNIEVKIFGDKYKLRAPAHSIFESKQRDLTYAVRIYVPIEIFNRETNFCNKKRAFLGELPLMTNQGTFVINGCERVIINQIVRSPGVYFRKNDEKNGKYLYDATLISNRGSWIKFELDLEDNVWIRIDRTTSIEASIFLNSLSTESELDNLSSISSSQNSLNNESVSSENVNFNDDSQENVFLKIFGTRYDIGHVGRFMLNQKFNISVSKKTRILTPKDINAIVKHLKNFKAYSLPADDIDHMQNRRVRSVGELLQNQFRIGLNRLNRTIKEKITVYNVSMLKPTTLVNPKPVIAAMKEFFGSSQLSQFMDQTNPLAALTHKRRISGLGPGGLNRDRISFAMRSIHPSHYGRVCPIETPEGQNAGLISSLSTYARINDYGFIETPFFKVKNGQLMNKSKPVYLTADLEDSLKIAPNDIAVNSNGFIKNPYIPIRYNQEFSIAERNDIDVIQVSPIQLISAATSLIPFLEHDDANRALMGSNMQRQAVPLLYSQKAIVGTGLETQLATDSGMVLISDIDGTVLVATSEKIVIKNSSDKLITYYLQKYVRSNQDTCINQRPIVWPGENVVAGQILADGPGTEEGEIALGQNLLIAYMPWEGYNYEDAILVSERLVFEDLFTSLHIEKFDIDVRQTKNGPEEITRDLPNVNEKSLRYLDETGIIIPGTFVKSGDILVGKITPKVESDQLPEGRLLRAIFGEKARDVKDSSLRLHNGSSGRVIDVRIFNRNNGDDVPQGSISSIRIFIAQIRKIQVGDKIAGRHGNKGIISRILPIQDMPYLPDGTTLDVILNPLGVPSRMNVGQLFECFLGLAGDNLNKRFKVQPFDEMYTAEASRILINKNLKKAARVKDKDWLFNASSPGRIPLIDGRTGLKFDNPITVGKAYMLKLVHLVDDKIHARSTGPYSLVTQQPLGGRSQNGGQRFGEMEVWALEAFGAAYILQELLTIKSDDMKGRNETLNSIVKGKPIPKSGIPESFKVLMRELQSLSLDISTCKIEKISKTVDDEFENNLMKNYIELPNSNTVVSKALKLN